ncbi:iron-containing alcohol dehydrogenase [Haloactinomyces albus]|uniref:Alcohol dehydrogenase class IV n=1 Tax=Haloactinomyces albus TaxID=1352928 RepID=A0AAE4CLD6_9ACTN|nr:iron-containing alcohol dehydrogenase [Haloactinomyces albus]MDR7301241.1 alcohol dehydrogenase class IV [Haloactinomyces albus]
MKLELDVPTHVDFGRGELDRIGDHARAQGTCALVVTGRTTAKAHGYLDRVLASLESSGVRSTVFDRVSANPRSDEVEAAAEQARRNGCDLVVGLGGGSALDAAKGVGVSVATGESVRDLIGVTLEADTPALPLIAIPTTAGSGSEVTKGAIITDTVRNFRSGLRGDAVFPRVAIVDPDLIASVPREVMVETVFDSFAHAVEGCVTARSDVSSRARAHQSIELIATHLPAVLRGEDSSAAREALCRAAVLGGVNVATVSTCLPHRLQQAMGSVPGLDISHGRGLAVLYPSWLRHTAPLVPDEFSAIAGLLGGSTLHGAVDRLLTSAGLRCRLRDWGVTKDDLERFTQSVTGNLGNDPAPEIGTEYIRTLYAESY